MNKLEVLKLSKVNVNYWGIWANTRISGIYPNNKRLLSNWNIFDFHVYNVIILNKN